MLGSLFGGCDHEYEIIGVEMSHIDPPKAWYSCECEDCEDRIGGHAEDLCDRVEGIVSSPHADAVSASDIEQEYINGRIDEIELEIQLEKLMGLRE